MSSSRYDLRSHFTVSPPSKSQTFDAVVDELADSFWDAKNDPVPVQVIDTLYWGSERALKTSFLQDQHIQVVINIGSKAPSTEQQHKLKEYYYIPLKDEETESLAPWIPSVLSWLEQAACKHQPTFIYCHRGQSRSAAFLCAYLMQQHQLSRDQAITLLKNKRTCCCMNDGFLHQLNEMDHQLDSIRFQRRCINYGLIYFVLLFLLVLLYWVRHTD
jgi:protein-tyrosine phosphatase